MIFIFLCIFMGFVLTLYFWPKDMPTRTFWFWMCGLLLPSGVGVISYALRLRHYEQQWERISYWNQLHREKEDEMARLGQQAIGLLGMAYATPAANNKLASALLKGAAPLQTAYLPGSSSVMTTAQLQPPATLWNEKEYKARLHEHLHTVLHMLEPELEQFAADTPFVVRLRHDGMLEDAHFLHLWQSIFPTRFTVSQIIFGQMDDGLMWLDHWLDEQNSALVLSLEVNLFGEGRDHQAESVSALLLASSAWLTQNKVSPAGWIHRPVVIADAKEALEDVVRWGRLSDDKNFFVWRSQLPVATQARMLQAMDSMNFPIDKILDHLLDSSFGEPGVAVGHIVLICACDHAISAQQPQWIMLQDKSSQWAIVRPA
ncbi:hypothetical protein EH227_07260 [Rouxiella chamberiensis]|nr:hypothetical protein EH227_07260 [Rouxiella chamberiensis]